jgi:NADH:ubiquinone oxidoreductase subunit 5 (subunit L)/multisubunit Na+/H+ antiporter MnhA subunit
MGHICSIFLAYFLLSRIFQESVANHVTQGPFTDWTIVIVTIVFLILFELTKRYIFNIFTKEFIQNKYNRLKTETIILFCSSILVIGFSFYFSITGANIFSDKGESIAQTEKVDYTAFKQEIDDKFDIKIKTVEEEIVVLRNQNKTSISAIGTANSRKTKSLNEQILTNNSLIKENENKLIQLKGEKELLLKEHKDNVSDDNLSIKTKNESNVFRFLLISIVIESFIIIGITFGQYFNYKILKEFSSVYDGIIEKKRIYDILLKLIYNEGSNKPGDIVTGEVKLLKLAQIKSKNNIKSKDIKNFFAETIHLKIFESQRNKRIIKEDYENAVQLCDNIFKV